MSESNMQWREKRKLKKVREGKLRFVIQKGIGDVVEFEPGVFATPIEESIAREIIMDM